MPDRFEIGIGIKSRILEKSSKRPGRALFAGALLMAGVILLLCTNISFARYAFTGFFWIRTDGTVTNPATTSKPTIQFATRNGAPHLFQEDYILLCGGRSSFCFVRNFSQGQIVPVVYDPAAPQRAFVYDWALFAGVITWFLEAGMGLVLALMLALLVAKKPLNISIRIGKSAGSPGEG